MNGELRVTVDKGVVAERSKAKGGGGTSQLGVGTPGLRRGARQVCLVCPLCGRTPYGTAHLPPGTASDPNEQGHPPTSRDGMVCAPTVGMTWRLDISTKRPCARLEGNQATSRLADAGRSVAARVMSLCLPHRKQSSLVRIRRRARQRGVVYVEYLLVTITTSIVLATALYTVGPKLLGYHRTVVTTVLTRAP